MEPFSDLIRLLRLSTRIYNNLQFCGDWRIGMHEAGQTCFHLVTAGSCLLEIGGEVKATLREGDLVIFPHEFDHRMYPVEERSEPQQQKALTDHAEGTGLLCGQMLFEHQAFHLILDSMPDFIHIPAEEGSWITPLLSQIRHETIHPSSGSAAIIDRLSELLFTYALRHIGTRQLSGTMFALHGDTRLAPAMAQIHADIARNHSLDDLAILCHMSRSNFARVFRDVSGWTVHQYVSWWRMQVAWSRLESGESIKAVALEVGYQSEAAFSKAFKKVCGVSPGRIRTEKYRSPRSADARQ